MTTESQPVRPLREVPVDLTNCDIEPIHQLGAIQPFGFLLAFTSDWMVARASANVDEHLGVAVEGAIGLPAVDLLLEDAIHALRNRLMLVRDRDAVERLFAVRLTRHEPDRLYDCALHFSEGRIVLEAETHVGGRSVDPGNLVRSTMHRLDAAPDLQAFLAEGARHIRAITGFDRVMVYRFAEDGAGEVVAETVRPGLGTFLGLNYPASDIPKQARALYIRTPFRIIADVDAVPVPVLPVLDESGAPLDLSLSVLRSVSPIHIEYLRNMGVCASLSVSILVNGRLWGLFACHHYRPLRPSFEQRTLAELIGQMFSLKLEVREQQSMAAYDGTARQAGDRLLAAVAGDLSLIDNSDWVAATLSEVVPCDGVAIWMDGRHAISGLAPPPEKLGAIIRRLNAVEGNRVFAVERLSSLLPEAEAYSATAAGLLAIPISRTPCNYVLLFRQERVRTVTWAGDPQKPAAFGPNGARLTPRASFDAWVEEVRGRALPFTPAEKRVAETLRASLVEVVLRLSEEAQEDRRRASERQDLLIAELNHRVRNILALIRGVARQSRSGGIQSSDFIALFEGRVEALARAHDQITRDQWAPAPLAPLIETEAAAYVGGHAGRLELSGPPVLLEPTAFSTLALVIHEMMTNSAKYGSLSDNGRLIVRWERDDDGDLLLLWREEGGPPVQAPTRSGFGSTIIHRAIPHDLGGKADIRYRLSGLEAQFRIPARHVRAGPEGMAMHPTRLPAASIRPGPTDRLLRGPILVLEDSLIIAMDLEDALRRLGARQVMVSANVDHALGELARERPAAAVLDVNLGQQNSLPVADRLAELGIPFLFATGYGEQFDVPERHRHVPLVQKPYEPHILAEMMAVLAAGNDDN